MRRRNAYTGYATPNASLCSCRGEASSARTHLTSEEERTSRYEDSYRHAREVSARQIVCERSPGPRIGSYRSGRNVFTAPVLEDVDVVRSRLAFTGVQRVRRVVRRGVVSWER